MKELEIGEDGKTRVMISPYGEFTLNDGSKQNGTVQHCTRENLAGLVERWQGEKKKILVDVDHRSELTDDTQAAGWITGLTLDDEGLWGEVEWTPKGLELVKGKEYRFTSPAWTLDGGGNPQTLVSVALTNKPNTPVKPVLNSQTNKGKPEMDKLKEILGLGAEATEDEVLAAVKSLKEAIASMKAAAAEKEAEEVALNAVKDGKIAEGEKENVKAAFLKNPEGVKAVLNAVVAVKAARSDNAARSDTNGASALHALNTEPALNAKRGKDPDLTADPFAEGLAKCKTPAEKVAFITGFKKQ